MRKFLPLIFLFLVATATYGQNKTLGVGTPAPNANAAMHVESPTNNQGFIMPRLTTAQRTGISSLLTATDNGLMLYDTDLKTIYIWDGAIWKSTAQVAGGSKLSYPYKDSVTTNPGAIDVFALKYNATDNARVMRIENQSATNGSSALSVYNQGVGLAGYFQVNNAASGASALYGTTNSDLGGALAPVGVYGQSTGTGSLGGSFRVSNAANTFPALYAETNGTGNVLNLNQINVGNTSAVVNIANAGTGNAIQTTGKIAAGQFIGNGSGLTNVTATNPRLTLPYQDSVLTAPANSNLLKLYYGGTAAANVGLAYFENLNPNNSFGPLFVRTLGIGSASNFFVTNTASAGAAVGGTTNGTGQAIRGLTTGTGQAGTFTVNNASNTSAALVATTNGSGSAIFSQNTGVGNGFAGNFTSTQATNTFPAIQANTAGTGPGVRVLQNASSLGGGMDVIMQNTSGTAVGFNVDQQGLGSAGSFGINNATNSSTALSAVTNGTGYALEVQATGTGDNALFNVSNPASSGSPVVATTNGIGLAGFFQVNNTTAGTTALQATTNSNVGGATPPVAIFGSATGTGASAGSFRINNATNPYAALFSQTNGTGMSLLVNHAGPSGNVAIFQSAGANVSRIDKTGQGFFNGGTQTSGADVAEMFEVEGARETYEPGDVLVISEATDRTVEKSSSASSTKVVGVYATKPGVTLTEKGIDENLDQLVPMGVIGVIPTKVCLENGSIKRGDLLVTSSKTGHAMKAISVNGDGIFPSGVIIGKALENFENGESGLIKVLVNVK